MGQNPPGEGGAWEGGAGPLRSSTLTPPGSSLSQLFVGWGQRMLYPILEFVESEKELRLPSSCFRNCHKKQIWSVASRQRLEDRSK